MNSRINHKNLTGFLVFYIHWGIIIGILLNLCILLNIHNGQAIITLFNKVAYIMFLLLAVGWAIKDKKHLLHILLLFLVWVCIFLFSILCTPDILIMAIKAIFYFAICIFIPFILFCQIKIKYITCLERAFVPYIYISVLYAVLEILVFFINSQYDMTFSYNILIPTLACITLFINKRQMVFFGILLFLIISNLICGSRGSLFCYIIFTIILFYFSNSKYKTYIKILMICLIVVSFLVGSSLLEILLQLFKSSRTIELLANGQFFYLSGRDKYYNYILEEFLSNPLNIKGIYSDRIYLASYFGRSSLDEIWGSYAHNIFLEFLFQFRIFAMPILAIFGFCTVYSIFIVKKVNNRVLKNTYSIFFSYCIGQLMFSSSYLSAPSFGCFLGMLVLVYSYSKEHRRCL